MLERMASPKTSETSPKSQSKAETTHRIARRHRAGRATGRASSLGSEAGSGSATELMVCVSTRIVFETLRPLRLYYHTEWDGNCFRFLRICTVDRIVAIGSHETLGQKR